MTERERLDQLEPLVAEIALKQDRMLGQIGMIVDQVSLHTVRLDDLTRRVTNTEKKIDSLANGLATVTLDVNRLHQRFEKLEQRQGKLEEGQNRLEQRIDKLKEGQNRLEQRIDKLEEGQNRLEQRFDRLEQRIDRLEHRLEKMDQTQELILMLLKEHLK